jgi:hypothetical protein
MSDLVPPMMPDDLDALIQAMERVQQLEAEVAKLRLTDDERDAVIAARKHLLWLAPPDSNAQDTVDALGSLLDRLALNVKELT